MKLGEKIISKKFVIYLLCGIIAISVGGCVLFNCCKKDVKTPEPVKENVNAVRTPVVLQKIETKKVDLYSKSEYDLPLISIIEISKLPHGIKTKIDKLLENSQGFYFLKADTENDTVKIILQNPVEVNDTYTRHGLQYAVINKNGEISYSNIGYQGEVGEITASIDEGNSDVWELDTTTETPRPIKHTVYDDDGIVKYTEYWNYSEKEPVKYEMKDGRGKVVSMLKETYDGDSNFRREHIFYDENGHTDMSISANYDGVNVSRFTYYDASSDDGVTVINEYENGTKTKEMIYDKDYELQATLTSEYEGGLRKNIKVVDKEGKETDLLSN